MNNRNCPQCGAPVDPGANCCKYCGEQIVMQQPVQQPIQQPMYQNNEYNNSNIEPGINPQWPIKSKMAAGLLAILLGGFGIHHFYLGKMRKGILCILFCWTYIPTVVSFIQGIIILSSSDHNFQVKNCVRIK